MLNLPVHFFSTLDVAMLIKFTAMIDISSNYKSSVKRGNNIADWKCDIY